jgi:hypothetical protein
LLPFVHFYNKTPPMIYKAPGKVSVYVCVYVCVHPCVHMVSFKASQGKVE